MFLFGEDDVPAVVGPQIGLALVTHSRPTGPPTFSIGQRFVHYEFVISAENDVTAAFAASNNAGSAVRCDDTSVEDAKSRRN